MSNKFSVTLFRNNVFTKDGLSEVFRVRSWDAVTDSEGKVTFKLKLSAAMSLPKGTLDNADWQAIVNKDGEITGHKIKCLVYGSLNSDKTGSFWLNPFLALPKGDRQWQVVERGTEGAKPMVFELGPWTGAKSEHEAALEKKTIAVDADLPF